jgi:hypothetical protein
MINLFFFLAIAFPQVSSARSYWNTLANYAEKVHNRTVIKDCDDKSSECCWVVNAYHKLGGKPMVGSHDADPMACCRITRKWFGGWQGFFSNKGNRGVKCIDGKVTEIHWSNVRRSDEKVPADIARLTNLQVLHIS